MIHEHDSVVLTQDLPHCGLQAGDVGVVVHIHADSDAYEVEFLSLVGATLTVETLLRGQVREAESRDVPHVGERAAA